MSRQPNPFVNPNQRGFDLPDGCKDLFEVLKQVAGEEEGPGGEASMTERGSLKNVPGHVERLYLGPRGYFLLITVVEKRGMLWVLRQNQSGFGLCFVVHETNKELGAVASELCRTRGYVERRQDESKAIAGPLPEMWLEATEIVESVVRGYDAWDNTRLFFTFGMFQGKAFFEK